MTIPVQCPVYTIQSISTYRETLSSLLITISGRKENTGRVFLIDDFVILAK